MYYRDVITRTIKLPNELDARLRRSARAGKLTFSEAARQAMQEGLRDEGGINMLEAAGDFIGCVNGPRDLSTNKAYFDDFGKDAKH
jgi:iron only hydrogenase large subunit-like protein